MNVRAIAAAALLASLPVASPAAGDAPALQALHQSFAGFKVGDGRIATLSYTDTVAGDRDGVPRLVVRTRRMGLLYRSDIQDVKGKIGWSNGFTGNLFWYSDQNGFTVPVFGDSAKTSIDRDLILTDAVATLPWTITGSASFYGKTMTTVRVEPEHAYPIELDIDPQTGAYGRIVIDPKGDREEVLRVLSYADAAPGTKLISQFRVEGDDAIHTISGVAANVGVTETLLHPPAPSARWQFADATPIPIRLTKDRILVKAKVNGVEGLFVLDTGAQDILISGAFARRAGLKVLGHSEVGGPDIDEKVDTGVASTISLGGNTLNNVTVYFGSKELDEEAPDGLLGFDLFGGALVTLDVENSTLQISDAAGIDPQSLAGVHVRADLGNGVPNVPMRVAHRVDLYALLDTGNPAEILIPYDLPQREGLHLAGDDEDCGNLDTLTLGPISFMTPAACRSEALTGHDAIVGYNFFRGFAKVFFDYPAATIVFAPPAKRQDALR